MPGPNSKLKKFERIMELFFDELIKAQGIHGTFFFINFIGGIFYETASPLTYSILLSSPVYALLTTIVAAISLAEPTKRLEIIKEHEELLQKAIQHISTRKEDEDFPKELENDLNKMFKKLIKDNISLEHLKSLSEQAWFFLNSLYWISGHFTAVVLPELIFSTYVSNLDLGDKDNHTAAKLTILAIWTSLAFAAALFGAFRWVNMPPLNEVGELQRMEGRFFKNCDECASKLHDASSKEEIGINASIIGDSQAAIWWFNRQGAQKKKEGNKERAPLLRGSSRASERGSINFRSGFHDGGGGASKTKDRSCCIV